ncbi:MAG: hypothetical protein PHG85_04730 [Candidatus Altiarchaeota archaeon]|nr:hypothetical protein [Candidatus Altiarchaeota archaeon]
MDNFHRLAIKIQSHRAKILSLSVYGLILSTALHSLLGLNGISGVISLIFLLSILSGKVIPRKLFYILIIILSLDQTSYFINFKNLDSLLINDDHPKFYTISVENANLLLKYGTPFGFNPDFQGGIPTLYLTSCFLELIPFALLLGNQMGYQVMLISYITAIPLSLLLLMRELVKDEDIARAISFISAFQLGMRPIILYGMTPGVVALPLSFLSMYLFIRFMDNKKFSLFPLSLTSGMLAYTHPGCFAITMLFFALILAYRLFAKMDVYASLKKLMCFGLLHLIICSPLYYNILSYASFFIPEYKYRQESAIYSYASSVFSNLKGMISLNNPVFILIISLLWLYVPTIKCAETNKLRNALLNALLFNTTLLLAASLNAIPQIFVFIERLDWFFTPFLIAINLSLFLFLTLSRRIKVLLIILLMVVIQNQYPPIKENLIAVHAVSDVDRMMKRFILPGDYALVENCPHINPSEDWIYPYEYCAYSHIITYLQEDVGARFFSHIDGDPHPYNRIRNVYLTGGIYDGSPLSGDNTVKFMKAIVDRGVNKACVWSIAANKYFNSTPYFNKTGSSQKYTCYAALYNVLPDVRTGVSGNGQITDETPFSFTVTLRNLTAKQNVTVNRNYFNMWSAYDGDGNKIEIRECGRKICFDAERDGSVYFKYGKNTLLNAAALLALAAALAIDLYRRRTV